MINQAFTELGKGVSAALETYSNVHRGSGHYSAITNQDHLHGKKRITMAAVTGASNVMGTFSDLEEISRIVHRHGALFLVDAAQMVAHRQVDAGRLGDDYLVFSGHKVYAPFGTGVLILKKCLDIYSSMIGEIKISCQERN